MPKTSKNDGREVPLFIEDHSRAPKVVRYERKKKLGQGGFATVYEVQEIPNNKIWACKVVHKRKLRQEHFKKLKNEVRLHRALNHRHIVGFETYFEDSERVYILLEHCANQSLMELLRRRTRLNERESQYFMWQILGAVEYLHSRNIIHRDLKLGNLLVDQHMQIKICDFGLAAQLLSSDERKTTICGTPNYIAPEILEGNRRGGHSFAVDIWSLGVILFTFLVGKPPFETKHVQQTYKRIKQLKYSFPPELRISTHAKHLISSILVINAERRPTLDQIKSDPFFTSTDIPLELPRWILYSPYSPQKTEDDARADYQKYKERRLCEEQEARRRLQSRRPTAGGPRELCRVSPTNPPLYRRQTDGGAPPTAVPCTRPPPSPPRGTETRRPRSQSSPTQHINDRDVPKPFARNHGAAKPLVFEDQVQRENPRPLHGYRPPEERISLQRQTQPLRPTNPHGIVFDLGDEKQVDPMLAVPERRRPDQVNGIVRFGSENRDLVHEARPSGYNHHASMTLESRRMLTNMKPSTGPKLPMKNRPRTFTDPADHGGLRDITNRYPMQHASISLDQKQMIREKPTRHQHGFGAVKEMTNRRTRRDVCGYEAGDDEMTSENNPPSKPLKRADFRSATSDAGKQRSDSKTVTTTVPTRVNEDRMENPPDSGSSRTTFNYAKKRRQPTDANFYDQLRSIHDEIEKSFCNAPAPEEDVLANDMERLSLSAKPETSSGGNSDEAGATGNGIELTAPQQSEVYVRQWVDYAKKYGIGYLLSNGQTGVYFNDSTKIVLHRDQQTVSYIDLQRDIQEYSISNFPSELTKKIQLLAHFQEYLTARHPGMVPHDSDNLVFIKKWIKTRHSILFRLSNKTIQINFNDDTEIILYSTTRLVTYTDKQRRRQTYPLEEILQTRQKDLRKRMRYTQDVLRQLVFGKK